MSLRDHQSLLLSFGYIRDESLYTFRERRNMLRLIEARLEHISTILLEISSELQSQGSADRE